MDDSLAHPLETSGSLDAPAWKTAASHVAALLTALLFLSAGIWKITSPFTWMTLVEQLLVPVQFSLTVTLLLGVSETVTGVLVLVPRFRRWGALLAIALLVVFMAYIGVFYNQLVGRDCSCFPWMKRAVNPAFFVEDLVMLALAFIAWLWARPSQGLRTAIVILGTVMVFSGVFYGVSAARQSGTKAPDTIVVDGKPSSLAHGRIFIYFYDPQCSHCEAAAKRMSKLGFGATRVIGVPTAMPQFAASFLHDTNFKAETSNDLEVLKKVFPFGDPPYGVVIENGHQKGAVSHFEGDEPDATLRKLGAIE